ncbi:hypothetical protein FisN_12Lh342 [Fistulifera solaris]|uniref:Uncharacterized protein n=1 Tax=Fistulifera solaris TaxID=1519565 RepID=A0A1Z5JLR9_FISSO|nr:hypothetical protein FisN_12Lh342 [Fistulifera solaris]|eukprot:GAX14957.1 hypothetical protein FisN_12Lh342 [Fistulifera solaris]
MSLPIEKPSVKATYWINGEQTEQRTWDASNTSHAVVGLLPEQDAAERPEPGEFRYSGRHDGGVLPPPKDGGPMALMIGCVQEAKNANDEYLTSVIDKEKDEIPHKKSKHDS